MFLVYTRTCLANSVTSSFANRDASSYCFSRVSPGAQLLRSLEGWFKRNNWNITFQGKTYPTVSIDQRTTYLALSLVKVSSRASCLVKEMSGKVFKRTLFHTLPPHSHPPDSSHPPHYPSNFWQSIITRLLGIFLPYYTIGPTPSWAPMWAVKPHLWEPGIRRKTPALQSRVGTGSSELLTLALLPLTPVPHACIHTLCAVPKEKSWGRLQCPPSKVQHAGN